MSHDRQGYHYPDEAAAPPANPGGYPSFNPQEMEVPNPKRRGSTFDTNNRIAHLSLQDRRDSVDSRSSLSGISMGGWAGDRRDSVYSTTSIASSVSHRAPCQVSLHCELIWFAVLGRQLQLVTASLIPPPVRSPSPPTQLDRIPSPLSLNLLITILCHPRHPFLPSIIPHQLPPLAVSQSRNPVYP